jgi:hypothetical protein
MSNLPAYLQQYQTPDVGQTLAATLGSSMPAHVSIGGNRFTLVDAAGNETPVPTFDPKIGVYLDAAIIDVNSALSRIYYDNPFDNAAEGMRPACFSDNGVGPSISAGSPQAATCQPDPTNTFGCRWAVWGSHINANGNKVPKCQQKQKVALLPVGLNTLFLLAIPPASHGPLREYGAHCKGHNIKIADLVTRIYFTSQGVLGFSAVSYIDEPTAVLRQAAYAEKKTDVLVGRGDTPRPAIAAPAQQPLLPPSTPLPQNQFVPPPLPNPAQNYNGAGQSGVGPQVHQQAGNGMFPQQGADLGHAARALQSYLRHLDTAAKQQAQQPGPFVPTYPAPNAASPGPAISNGALPAGTTSPSDQPAQRRRRRTQAEIAADNAAAAQPNGGIQQAPFPQPGAGQQAQPQQAEFGIAQGQPAVANPELATMLDDFFTEDNK